MPVLCWHGGQCLACVECACTLLAWLPVSGMCRVCLYSMSMAASVWHVQSVPVLYHGFHLKKVSWIPGEVGADSFTTAWWTQCFVMGTSGELRQLPREVFLVHGENDGLQSIAQGWQQRGDGRPHQLDHFLQAAEKETFNYSGIPQERPPWWEITCPLGPLFCPDTIPLMFPHLWTPDCKDLPSFRTILWTNSLLLD